MKQGDELGNGDAGEERLQVDGGEALLQGFGIVR